MALTDTHIKSIFTEFQSLKSYTDKVRFYDVHFELIPHRFPACYGDPYTLFSTQNVNFLLEILQEERKHPFHPVRKFVVSDQDYAFSIQPRYSNYSAFNEYVVTKFLHIIAPHSTVPKKQRNTTPLPADLVTEMVSHFLQQVSQGPQAALRAQMVHVFHKGYTDFIQHQKSSFTRKKKFIELYLYAQGIVFARRLLVPDKLETQNPLTFHKTQV
jgi:hypothetical protein